ncbi:MAG: MarR family transcriptional regulator [Dehalococcoidia bacterium]|jgi:DNA-binding MarR family transcriptional regulator
MEKEELIGEIIALQRKVDRVRRQYQLDIWMSLPLTIAQLKCLFFISNHGSTNSSKLAEALRVTPTNITGIVDRLVKQGLVSRSVDAQDRRMLVLKATIKGEGLVANLRERKRSRFSKALAYISTDDLAILHQGLTSLAKAVEARKEEANADND